MKTGNDIMLEIQQHCNRIYINHKAKQRMERQKKLEETAIHPKFVDEFMVKVFDEYWDEKRHVDQVSKDIMDTLVEEDPIFYGSLIAAITLHQINYERLIAKLRKAVEFLEEKADIQWDEAYNHECDGSNCSFYCDNPAI